MIRTAQIESIEQLGSDIFRVVLDGTDLPMRYLEGQFLSLQLPCGSLRSYSLAQCCNPDSRLELHVRLRVGGRMAAWLPTLKKGDEVKLHGPFGACVWDIGGKGDNIVMLATGTGIAPLHAILRAILATDAALPVTMYWGARTLNELYMLKELQQLARLKPSFTFIPVLSKPSPEWNGAHGYVQHIAATRHPNMRQTDVYACGSSVMIAEARDILIRTCYLDHSRFFADAFEPAELALDAKAPTVEVLATLPDGSHQRAAVAIGNSLYRGLQSSRLINGVCGGKLSCGMCRVRPGSAFEEVMPGISAAEQRLLASLDDYVPGDRLACQIPVVPLLDGLTLNIYTSVYEQSAVTQTQIEAVGPQYDPSGILALRHRTFEAIRAIASQFHPGMLEENALELAKSELSERGMLQGWHGVYVRFGSNTVKSWSEKSEPGVVLKNNDIFFIDIGPTWQGLEGDGAMTFLTGDDSEMRRCEQDARIIFDEVRQRWLDTDDSGQALYDFARTATERRGWILNLELSGHRLGDFPHAAHFDGTMAEIDFRPSAQLWVLEIHIRDPNGAYGAYFEDLLLPFSV